MSLEKSFASTSKILFGKEIGALSEFALYLFELVEKPFKAKSFLSGKDVYLSRQHYSARAKFAGIGEIARKTAELSINEMKDIDSLQGALSEKFFYCGNKNLGTSIGITESDACNDSIDVLHSQNVISSKAVAYSNGVRQSEAVFGCQLGGEVAFSMRCQIFFYSKRCFETYVSERCSDSYFSFDLRNCSECMFSFNQTGKRHCIGNMELPKEKYMALKKKLVSEIAEGLAKDKKYPSLFELCGGAKNG